MGRKVRMIPPGWEHPKEHNQYRGMVHKPLLPDFATRHADWLAQKAKWDEGLVKCYRTDGWKPITDEGTFEDWIGEEPDPSNYMPEFEPGTATMFVMYEDTSEGTPISPAFATPEELARWLADNGASSFAASTASYEAWLSTIKRGFAPSAIMGNGVIQSGVEALHEYAAPAADEDKPEPETKSKLTREEIMAQRTPQGGWTRDTLAQWGVSWPPPKGWIDRLCSNENEPDEIHKMICLSTSHVCEPTADSLEYNDFNDRLPVFHQKANYGWFIHVSTDSTPTELAEYPEDIQSILAYARARGCGWIMLDKDGPVVDGLKTWEW